MSLYKVDSILNNVDRIVQSGKRDKLQLIDPTTKEVIHDVRFWNWRKLNPLEQGAPTYAFKLAQTAGSKEDLPTCGVASNGMVHDIVVRTPPDSVSGIEWELRTRPTNESIEE